MNERQLQFRVGLFVIMALSIAVVLIFQFGDLRRFWDDYYTLTIRFERAPGVYPAAPVRKSGITIGSVGEVTFDDQHGGVLVVVNIRSRCRLRADSRPFLNRSLLGETTVEFTPGMQGEFLTPGAMLEGEVPPDPMEIVSELEHRTQETLAAFTQTSQEWRQVARNLNMLMETRQGDLDLVIERAAESLHQFSTTMQNANQMVTEANGFLGDPELQRNMRQTMTTLPQVVEETRQILAATRQAIEGVDENLRNVSRVTGPLARRGESMALHLDHSLTSLDLLLSDLTKFSRVVAEEEGTIQQLAKDPELYRNMDRSAQSLAVLLKNLEPVARDLRIFSDKIARHPELIGVSGAINGSSGLKDPAEAVPKAREAARPLPVRAQ